ncbi:hypothetical protein HALDL1_02395 [Halobacterium sp. DL1]|jgi:predicted small metal-binding protein|nr:hypothetical protein HALDL1_02395 [Halobacterium sp. DL1]
MAYQASCQEDEFMVKSDDEQEVLSNLKDHAHEKHDMEMSDDDARDMMEQT